MLHLCFAQRTLFRLTICEQKIVGANRNDHSDGQLKTLSGYVCVGLD